MRLADMHIHTTFSPDGKSSMEEQCIKAIEIGIPTVGCILISTFLNINASPRLFEVK